MAVQSSKFVPWVTFSLEKGKFLVRVDFQAITRRAFVVLSKLFFGCSF